MSVVIIPAYKPDETLLDVVDKLWTYGCEIIVVDDGSGEEYLSIFERICDASIILHHATNMGKGVAIKTALSYIKNELWENHAKALVLGVRNVGKDMPWKSRWGNRITRTVFRLLSGAEISDTQTGLRAFRMELLDEMYQVSGERYEYETNVLMQMVTSNVPIIEIPIHTIYRNEKNSTSHFRVIKDSVSIYKDLLGKRRHDGKKNHMVCR